MEAIVEYNYAAKEPDELTLRKGDVIKDIKVMPGGWWEGTLKDKRGMFPDNFVKVVDGSLTSAATSGTKSETEVNNITTIATTSINATSTTSIVSTDITTTATATTTTTIGKKDQVTMRNGSSSGSRWCKVLFAYEPCNEDELKLVPNDIIEFLCEVEEGWWSGKLNGRVGVFPSNFVSQPSTEEPEKTKPDKVVSEPETAKELCRVLFPYEAANEDELTLVEGDIITIISRDAPDKGWWKGELKGKIGLFPDNFVKIVAPDDESPILDETKLSTVRDIGKTNSKTSTVIGTTTTKTALSSVKKIEKAVERKSIDTRVITPIKKPVSTSPLSPSVSSLVLNNEKKIAIVLANSGGVSSSSISLPMSTNLKRTTKNTSNDNIDSADSIYANVDEELDGVEREEYTPLLHLTATRVKAPRRRLPSSHCIRSQTSFNSSMLITNSTSMQENTVTNGTTIDTVDQSRDEESESILGKTRQKAPWIKELKLNQMEKKKTLSADNKFDKTTEVLFGLTKKEKNYTHDQIPLNVTEVYNDQNQDNDEIRLKERDKDNSTYQRINSTHLTCPVSPTTSPGGGAYVPYRLYCQLLDRVALLEERQTALQRTVTQLSEQIGPLLVNSNVISNKP